MTITIGSKVLDFSGARPGASNIKTAGATGVMRYLSPPAHVAPGSQWKVATKSEVDSYLAIGVDVTLNWEWYTGRCNEGSSAGTQDGEWALASAKALGYPQGAVIFVSHDTSANNVSAILKYFAAFNKALDGYYQIGVYGSYFICETLQKAGVKWFWQTIAWSNHVIGKDFIHLYQNAKQWFNSGADENVVYHTWPSWLQTHPPVQPPHPKPTPKPKPEPKPKPVPNPVGVKTVRVLYGDTLTSIAKANKVTVAQLVAWNKGRYSSIVADPDKIDVGWILRVSAGGTKPTPPKHDPVTKVTTYTIHNGDFLGAIAAKFHTTVSQLQHWNAAKYPSLIKNPNLVYPGWVIRVK